MSPTTPGISPEEFWQKVNIGKRGDCWEWKLSCYKSGYGKIGINGKSLRAHRVAWIVSRGPIPKGLFVLHTCDNRKCVNPDHLFLGTQKQNLKDMIQKGRGKGQIPAGEDHPGAKLTWPQIALIRRLGKQGVKQKDLAKTFDVRPQTIQLIVHNKIWKS